MRFFRGRMLAGLALAFVLSFGVAACSDDDGDSIEDQAGDVVQTVSPDQGGGDDQNRDDFINDVENEIDELEGRIDELEDEAANKTGDERQEAEEQIDQLQSEVNELKGKLADMRDDNDEEFERKRDEIENSLDDAKSKAESLADDLGL